MGNSQQRRNREAIRQAMEASMADMPLPFGWEERYTDKGVLYYIDHSRQKTTYQDPRRKKNSGIKKPKGKPPKYEATTYDKCQSIVARLHKILSDQDQLDITVCRDTIFDDSFKIISQASAKELTRRLFIKFVGEEGLDYGGMSREWFLSLSEEIFSKKTGLFTYSQTGYFYQISRFSAEIPNCLEIFRFVGRALAMAVYHGKLLQSRFSVPFYKALLGRPLEFEDLKHIDEAVYKSLTKVIDAENVNSWGLTFSIGDTDNNGNYVSINLRNPPLTPKLNYEKKNSKEILQKEKEKQNDKLKKNEKEKKNPKEIPQKEKQIEKEKKKQDDKDDDDTKEEDSTDSESDEKDSEENTTSEESEKEKKTKKEQQRQSQQLQRQSVQLQNSQKEEEEEEEVTNETKKEYVDLVFSYYVHSTKKQMDAIRLGFLELIPQEFLDELEPQELEMMLFGRQDIDVKELQEHTNFDNGLSESSPVVKLFWEVVEKFSQDELRRFLVFCTGSAKVPLGGFAHLYGSNGPQKFTLYQKNSPGLPTAHACFNRLELYYYSDPEQLKKELLYAITETQGFALE